MIHPIRYYGDPVLRQEARRVTEFGSELEGLAEDMIETMYAASGVGLAAPQIGVPARLFVAVETADDDEVGDDVGEDEVGEDEVGEDEVGEDAPDTVEAADPPERELTADEKRERWGVVADWVFVNPEILERDGVQYGQEGCLSIPGLYVERLRRSERIRVRFQDVHGETHERDVDGYFARIIQHELDHLDGVLFFDRLPDAERHAFMETHRSELAEMQREAKALLKHLRRTPSQVPSI